MLCQLGATVRLRDELADWLVGFVPEEETEEEEAAAAEDAFEEYEDEEKAAEA